ncbi:hypothetical protein P7K49_012947 [Saguinus oedipus]|uniref:Uncharacterized protein n=1 Tax=Saguinus oedipus TaxID=9490 RepID=A0ABQ9VHG7_SAGOE|nr:hypothetical protein P7K49_012947 [Saguinus oedipus]
MSLRPPERRAVTDAAQASGGVERQPARPPGARAFWTRGFSAFRKLLQWPGPERRRAFGAAAAGECGLALGLASSSASLWEVLEDPARCGCAKRGLGAVPGARAIAGLYGPGSLKENESETQKGM